MTSLLVADDKAITRAGLHHIIEFEPYLKIVGEVVAPEQVLSEVLIARPAVLLLDFACGGDRTAGLRLLKKLERLSVSTKIIAFSHDEALLERVKRIGAAAAVPKDFPSAELFAVIRAVASEGWPAMTLPSTISRDAQAYLDRPRSE